MAPPRNFYTLWDILGEMRDQLEDEEKCLVYKSDKLEKRLKGMEDCQTKRDLEARFEKIKLALWTQIATLQVVEKCQKSLVTVCGSRGRAHAKATDPNGWLIKDIRVRSIIERKMTLIKENMKKLSTS